METIYLSLVHRQLWVPFFMKSLVLQMLIHIMYNSLLLQSSCYLYQNSTVTWPEATAACIQADSNSHLVIIQDNIVYFRGAEKNLHSQRTCPLRGGGQNPCQKRKCKFLKGGTNYWNVLKCKNMQRHFLNFYVRVSANTCNQFYIFV